ncbi:YdaS family helix-turn-helix protein [Sphingomonas sp. CARO-RG-8B-R24-01]|uniref:transcriptional regulator n=1 Tax=Sphingomonas sp. CARO-RG-8B-R24-01 TaxID=2914831 RepID=UPI001F5721BC|nr:YdaS family helix-turn-helix protein [Sphingomonas sp. CARO-RG-8B-R24-01]
MDQTPLTRALSAIGGQAALSRAVGVSQPSVWHWVHRSRRVPAEFVLAVETATGVSRHELRPDLYPIERAAA